MIRVSGQITPAYVFTGGVGMVDDDVLQQIEVIHTVPVMTDTERRVAEKRVSNDLFTVLSAIFNKLNVESE